MRTTKILVVPGIIIVMLLVVGLISTVLLIKNTREL
jgi:hypothetical protein